MLKKINNMTDRQKKTAIIVSVLTLLLIVFIVVTAVGNANPGLSRITVQSDRLPKSFDGYRIALISDLHNAEFGEDNEKLLSALRESAPNIIVITGDMIDSRHTNTEVALSFASEAAKIASCYYVSGNHEARIDEYTDFKNGLISFGVTVIEDKRVKFTRNGESITLAGLSDLGFDYAGNATAIKEMITSAKLKRIVAPDDQYTILLNHRPDFFEIYSEFDVDLVLSGHIHGGQIRLPFIGGLAGGKNGIFPEYDAGLYTDGNTNMVVSRGIGNSSFPVRVNNRPEIVLVELKSAK